MTTLATVWEEREGPAVPLSYHAVGPVYERMLDWHNSDLPGVAATVLQVTEVYTGADKLM